MDSNEVKEILNVVDGNSSPLNNDVNEVAIILAAGHGKRIKSQKSKMLHKIWGVPTVERVYYACRNSLKKMNIIVVVGIKAKDVVQVLGKRESTAFAYQKEQNGTGHAVQVALEKVDRKKFDGTVYVLPGDMGLIDAPTIKKFREDFKKSGSDMMVLTGIFEGKTKDNAYGRIIRVKEFDDSGSLSGNDSGRVIEIMENKDIQSLADDKPYKVKYNGRTYSYSKQELVGNKEFNSGVYAFKYKKLAELVHSISSDNVQNEIYITDLIALFNKNGYSVTAVSPKDQDVLMGFNNKSVLLEMEGVARKKAYDRLKDIIAIDDPDDFFIDDSVGDEIIEMDRRNIPLDISIGKGVHIGKGVKLNYNLDLEKNVFVDGNVKFGEDVIIRQNVYLSCFPGQTLEIGNRVEILSGDIIKGNIVISDGTRIESSVNMTGSDEFPLRIGSNVLIKGTSYIFGSFIEDDVYIEHSVIIKKQVDKIFKRDGSIQPVRFYLPMPEGIDAIEELKEK